MWKHLLASWNPNKYNNLRELSLLKVAQITAATTLLSVAIFIILVLPAVFQAENYSQQLSKTTNITISANLQQSIGTYVLRNPDILITSSSGDGFIVVRPDGITIKRFIFFGAKTYSWQAFSSLQAFPASEVFVPLFFFILPSLLFWGAIGILLNILLWTLLYSLLAYFVLHARNFRIVYSDLWKVSFYASLPGTMLIAVLPVLRLGLPLAMILGFVFVLWLVLTLLGTALFAEKHTGHRKLDLKKGA